MIAALLVLGAAAAGDLLAAVVQDPAALESSAGGVRILRLAGRDALPGLANLRSVA